MMTVVRETTEAGPPECEKEIDPFHTEMERLRDEHHLSPDEYKFLLGASIVPKHLREQQVKSLIRRLLRLREKSTTVFPSAEQLRNLQQRVANGEMPFPTDEID